MGVAGSSFQERLSLASEACHSNLSVPPFPEVLTLLGKNANPQAAFQLLSQITVDPSSAGALGRLRDELSIGQEDNLVERSLLMLASEHAARQVPALPISDRMKELFAEEFDFFANPPAAWVPAFRFDHVRYREMARIVTLRRFPAGQFHWELAGFPRSWVTKTPTVFGLLRHIATKMGGFSPLFELHLNDRRKNKLMLLEKESNFTYYRAARSLEKQPAIKGVMSGSWFFCKETAEITPRLAWLREVPLSGGAKIFDLGPAPSDSGFLIGSEERRSLYEQGSYKPQVSCFLWSRADLIAWANAHPEFHQ